MSNVSYFFSFNTVTVNVSHSLLLSIHTAYQIDWLLSLKYHCTWESLAVTVWIFGTIVLMCLDVLQ